MKRILLTPLDWGLGHATRCIPIVRELLRRECTVFIAGSGDSLSLLKNEFPQLLFFTLPAYQPVYPSGRNMLWTMILQVPKFIAVIKNEHLQVESIIEQNRIDLIISDNRYGCWSARIRSVFITHQLNILMPKGFGWLAKPVRFINERLIKKFSHCWIPDYADEKMSLSGKLTRYNKSLLHQVTHIGPLSRFNNTVEETCLYDIVCILSGPEPQRTIFENKVINQLRTSGLRYFLVKGIFSKEQENVPNERAFLNSEALQNVISQSSVVIARSGYSTLMDLTALGKKGIVVPTPGQTEQEYLAVRWNKKGVLYSMTQESFNLQIALKESDRYTGFTNDCNLNNELLTQQIELVLSSL